MLLPIVVVIPVIASGTGDNESAALVLVALFVR